MICNRRTFFTGSFRPSRWVPDWPGPAHKAQTIGSAIGVIGTGGRARGLMTLLKRLPGNEMVAVCDVYEPRVLQAAEIAGTADDEGRRLPPHPRRPRDRCGRDRHARSLAQDDHARRGRGGQGRLRREAGLAHDRRRRGDGEGHREPRSRSCRPARSSAAGITGCSASRSSTPAGWDRSPSSRPTGISTRPPATTRRSRWTSSIGNGGSAPAPDQPFRPERFYQWRHFWDFGGGS